MKEKWSEMSKQKKIEISYENSEDLEALLKLLCGDTFFENNI